MSDFRTRSGTTRLLLISMIACSGLLTNYSHAQDQNGAPATEASQAVKPPPTSFRELRRSLPQVWTVDRIRVFYDTTGPHAVNATDADGNSVPDQVQDVATQAWAALLLWSSLGFPEPLKGERYGEVDWIDIHMISRDTLNLNGVCYDEIQTMRRPIDPPGTKSVLVDVATSIKTPGNMTPAHEMFHVIQNGATYFKNRWWTEGTARWSEKGLGVGGLPKGELATFWPPAPDTMEQIYQSAYDASYQYWAPMLLKHSRMKKLPRNRLPKQLLQAKYVNGEPVLIDDELVGWDLMREVFIALGKADDLAHQERQLTGWPEAEQRSEKNNEIIHDVIEQVANRHSRGRSSRTRPSN